MSRKRAARRLYYRRSFLNRRGYAPLTLCRACGHRFACTICDAWLVDHRFRQRLVCHHCGFSMPRPRISFATRRNSFGGNRRMSE